MKRFIRPSTILIISILLGLFSVASSRSISTQTARFTNQTGAAFFFQTTATPQVQEEDKSEIGSTDGITLMSFLIFAIILIPILLQRKSWSEV